MKSSIKGLFVILFILLGQYSLSQSNFLKDSIAIELGNYSSIEFIAEDFHNRDRWGNLDSIYHLFVTDLNKVDNELITSSNSNSMEYDYRNQYRNIRFNSESFIAAEVFVDPQGNIIYFQKVMIKLGEKDEVWFRASSIDALKKIDELDLNELLIQADKMVSPDGQRLKKHKAANLVYENNAFSQEKSKVYSRPTDMIELSLGIGLGTLRSDLAPDLEFDLLLGLSKKGRLRHRIGFSNQWIFSFPLKTDGSYRVEKDAFLDLLYSISYKSSTFERIKSMGIKAGTLVTPNGYNFNNAYRFGLFRSLGDGINLEGGIFLNDNFKEFYPYARLSWSW